MRKEKWAAIYLPMLPPNKPDPSRYDFSTKAAAHQYIVDRMCKDCQDARIRYLNGTSNEDDELEQFDSEYPACYCEWVVEKTRDYKRAKNISEVMEAAGAKLIYKRDDK